VLNSHRSRVVALALASAFAALCALASTAAVTSPDDPLYPSQWGLTKIRAHEAWDVTHGSETIDVAVVDTGILVLPELSGQVGAGYNAITPPW
jgi:hypothetical protein